MSYQKCPICDGTGKVIKQPIKDSNNAADVYERCHTCLGNGIIHEETGAPPTSHIKDE